MNRGAELHGVCQSCDGVVLSSHTDRAHNEVESEPTGVGRARESRSTCGFRFSLLCEQIA